MPNPAFHLPARSEPLRLLAFGGCHVIGYPYHPRHSFVNVASAILKQEGLTVEAEAVGYMRLRDTARLRAAVGPGGCDVLLLQMGHWEPVSIPALRDLFPTPWAKPKRSAPAPSKSKASAAPAVAEAPSSQHFQPGPAWHFRVAAKRLLARVLRHKLVRTSLLRDDTEQMLAAVCALPVGHAMMLSPFPCPDPVITQCRRIAAGIFAQACRDNGIEFVDVFHLFDAEFGATVPPGMFADTRHLSVAAQERIGALVAERIKAALVSGSAGRTEARIAHGAL